MRNQSPKPARFIGFSIALVAAVLLIGCGGTMAHGPEPVEPASSIDDGPPQSTLSYDGQTQVGGTGSFCWEQLCADMAGIPVPNDRLIVPTGSLLVFEFSGSEPLTEVHAAARPLQGQLIDGAGMHLLQSAEEEVALLTVSSGNQTDITDELEPGEYSVTVNIRIDGSDALYGFHVVIQ